MEVADDLRGIEQDEQVLRQKRERIDQYFCFVEPE
jgi:hypothetical protein